MLAFVQQYAAIGLIVVGAAGFLYSQRAWLWSFMPKRNPLRIAPATLPDEDEDTLDFHALARLRHRFERLKCKEGLEACTTQQTHFFHGPEGSH